MDRVRLEFGAWEPDAALYGGSHAPEAKNVLTSRRGYEPMRGVADAGYGALDSAVKAGYSQKDTSGNILTLAATGSGIYALENKAWAAKFTGEALTEGRAFCEYGAEVYALFGNALLKSHVTGGNAGEFSAVSEAPHGEAVGVIRDFLVLGNLSGQANAIRWSGLDRPDTWPEVGSDEAQYL